MTVKPRDRCSAIKHQIERDLGLAAVLNLLDIYDHGVYAIFQDNMAVSKIRKTDEVVCYESHIPGKETGKRGTTHVVVLHYVPKEASPTGKGMNTQLFNWGAFVLFVPLQNSNRTRFKNKYYWKSLRRGWREGKQWERGERLYKDTKIVLHECTKNGQLLSPDLRLIWTTARVLMTRTRALQIHLGL